MIKNATIYRIADSIAILNGSLSYMEAALDAQRFVPCSGAQAKSLGWVSPRKEEHGALVESIDGWRVLRFMIETKSVPGDVVRKQAQEAADKIESDTGCKPGKKEARELREDALLSLLPGAFPRQAAVWVLINTQAGLLITDANNAAKNDQVVTALVSAFADVSVSLLETKLTPLTAMTNWLVAESPDDWPEGFSIERECELRSTGEEKSVIRFSRHNLVNDEIRKHITEGKLPKRLAMSWESRIGFVLTDFLSLKKLQFLEGVFENRSSTDNASCFDTDVALTTGELDKLIPALVAALGGEIDREVA